MTTIAYDNVKLVGINLDLPAHELPPDTWSGGNNVRFYNNSAEQVKGWTPVLGAPLFAPSYLLPNPKFPSYYWVYAGMTGIGVTDMVNHYDITPVAGVLPNINDNWNGGILNGVVVLNDGTSAPIWWDNSPGAPMTVLPGWPAGMACKVIKPYKNFLIALNIDGASGLFTNMVKWSDQADPGAVPASWDETDPTLDAGETTLSDSPGDIITGAQLGEDFIVYKYETCHVMRFIGGRYVFSFKKLFTSFGCISVEGVATVGNTHIVWADGDIYRHDTNAYESILTKRMRNWLFGEMNPEQAHKAYILEYHERNELWFCFCPIGQETPNKALVWEYEANLFSVRDIPACRHMVSGILAGAEALDWDLDGNAWDDDTTYWNEQKFTQLTDYILGADVTNTRTVQVDTTDLFDGDEFEAFLERTTYPMLDMSKVKLITEVWPKLTAPNGTILKMNIGTQMAIGDPVVWGGEQSFVVGTDRKIDVVAKGRYLSARVTVKSQGYWRLHSFDIKVQDAERW